MTNRMFRAVLLLMAVAISTAAFVQWGVRGEPAAGGRPAVRHPQDRDDRGRLTYPEIQGPAALLMDLAEGVAAGMPVTIRVSVSSTIAVSSGLLTLHVPEIAGEPNGTEALWNGTAAEAVAETAMYPAGPLPVGRYCFVAIFEFTPAGEDAQEMAISQCLYLDVRPTAILSSNVSFEQIQRVELRQELERRILTGLKPKLAAASEDMVARERARLEAADPGFMDRAIDNLIATDPGIARRAMEFNERRSKDVTDGTDPAENN